jgi:hypothetical protein
MIRGPRDATVPSALFTHGTIAALGLLVYGLKTISRSH